MSVFSNKNLSLLCKFGPLVTKGPCKTTIGLIIYMLVVQLYVHSFFFIDQG